LVCITKKLPQDAFSYLLRALINWFILSTTVCNSLCVHRSLTVSERVTTVLQLAGVPARPKAES
jgi:hypothetical protein